MLDIKKTYLTDENKRPVAVQVDIKTFEKMEQLLEDYALGKFIEENDPEENLSLNEAQEYYNQLKKKWAWSFSLIKHFWRNYPEYPPLNE